MQYNEHIDIRTIIDSNNSCNHMSFQVLDDFTILLMNMIFAELVMVLFGVPVNFIASIQHGWKMGKSFCQVTLLDKTPRQSLRKPLKVVLHVMHALQGYPLIPVSAPPSSLRLS